MSDRSFNAALCGIATRPSWLSDCFATAASLGKLEASSLPATGQRHRAADLASGRYLLIPNATPLLAIFRRRGSKIGAKARRLIGPRQFTDLNRSAGLKVRIAGQ